jgi:hypothetical protein
MGIGVGEGDVVEQMMKISTEILNFARSLISRLSRAMRELTKVGKWLPESHHDLN